jgi:hypothetical protein
MQFCQQRAAWLQGCPAIDVRGSSSRAVVAMLFIRGAGMMVIHFAKSGAMDLLWLLMRVVTE